MAWETASVVIKLDKSLPNDYLKRIGQELVRLIEDRTLRGVDKNGRAFEKYSDDYKKSDEFIITGKRPNPVNLKLSGEMLADFSVLSAKDGTIILGFEREEQRAKAHGHQTGAEGRLPVRDFLGVNESEIASVFRKLPPPAKVAKAKESLIEAALKALLDDPANASLLTRDSNLLRRVVLTELLAKESEVL